MELQNIANSSFPSISSTDVSFLNHSEITSLETDQSNLFFEIQQAIGDRDYEEVLKLTDQIDDQERFQVFHFHILSLQAFCLSMLGRHTEALALSTYALENVDLGMEEIRERVKEYEVHLIEELSWSQEMVEQFVKEIRESFDELMTSLTRQILIDRGLIKLQLNQKELAIEDFKEAVDLESLDSIFFFKLLERKLDAQILPLERGSDEMIQSCILRGDYERALEILSKESPCSCRFFEQAICCALLGEYEDAYRYYEFMDLTTSFQDDYPPMLAIIHYLEGDVEKAREVLKNGPLPEGFMNYELLFNIDTF